MKTTICAEIEFIKLGEHLSTEKNSFKEAMKWVKAKKKQYAKSFGEMAADTHVRIKNKNPISCV